VNPATQAGFRIPRAAPDKICPNWHGHHALLSPEYLLPFCDGLRLKKFAPARPAPCAGEGPDPPVKTPVRLGVVGRGRNVMLSA
jgi:hypothetical protein